MNIQWQTVFISVFSSLIVSIIMFILGLKAGKAQSDRKAMKRKYLNISVYFNRLLSFIESAKVLKMKITPLIREMTRSGEMLDLPNKLQKELKNTEEDVSIYLSKINQYAINNIKPVMLEQIKLYCPNLIQEINTIKTMNFDFRKSTCEYSYCLFFVDKELSKICKELNQNIVDAIIFDDYDQKLYIYNDTLNEISTSQFLRKCQFEFMKDNNFKQLVQEGKELIRCLETTIQKINNRVKDPFTFWEILFGAFYDVFKI